MIDLPTDGSLPDGAPTTTILARLMPFGAVAVGTAIEAAPRTDPGVRRYRTGLLPRMIDEKPLFRPRMLDARIGQVTIGDYLHSRPCKPMLLSPPPDGVEPAIDQMVPERCDRRRAHRHGVVGQPATKHLGKPFALRFDAVMAGRLELFLDLSQLRPHPLANWRPSQHEAAAASLGRAKVREPKEVERLRLAETSGAAGGNCLPAELDEPRLFGMEAKPEIGHAR